MMTKIKNKDDYFVIFDFNCLWRYAEAVLKMGYTQGFFPLKSDYDLEADRDAGKEIVKKHYKNLKVAEVHEFKKIEEAITFLGSNTANHTYVLKGYSDDASTVLPAEGKTFQLSPDVELAKQELIGALEVEQKDFEKKGFLLEQKVVNPLEITPEAVFYNGKLLITCVDIENKPIGAGSTGCMTGCAGNLIIKTNEDEEINKLAFPPFVYEMAKDHTGLFVWDASILIDPKDGQTYFGEFCANRWGWDSFFAELTMCDSVTDYFESIVKGENPLKKTFGVGVRMFNLKKHKDVPIILKDSDKGVFIYDALLKDEKTVTSGADWDTLSANASSNNPNEAVDGAYKVMDNLSFNNGYFRPRFDFLSTDYPNAIVNRYAYANHKYFEAPDFKDNKKEMTKKYEDQTAEMTNSHKMELKNKIKEYEDKISIIKEEIKQAINA
jgi:hypothetical protein